MLAAGEAAFGRLERVLLLLLLLLLPLPSPLCLSLSLPHSLSLSSGGGRCQGTGTHAPAGACLAAVLAAGEAAIGRLEGVVLLLLLLLSPVCLSLSLPHPPSHSSGGGRCQGSGTHAPAGACFAAVLAAGEAASGRLEGVLLLLLSAGGSSLPGAGVLFLPPPSFCFMLLNMSTFAGPGPQALGTSLRLHSA